MKRNRSVCLIGGLTALFLVAVFLLYPVIRGPRTEEASVRAVLFDMIAAVLDEDFEEEWSFYSTSAQERWSDELAKWRVLEADSDRWGKLFAFHALTRADVLRMDAETFFIAIRRSKAYADPDEWAASQDLLRNLGPGEFKLRKNGSASISFDNDLGPEVDIHTTAFEFVREDGYWKFAEVFDMRMKFGVLLEHDRDEPGD